MQRSASKSANASEPVGRRKRAARRPPLCCSARLAGARLAARRRLAARGGHSAPALLGARSRLLHAAARGRTLCLVRLLLLLSEKLVEEAHVVSLIEGAKRSIRKRPQKSQIRLARKPTGSDGTNLFCRRGGSQGGTAHEEFALCGLWVDRPPDSLSWEAWRMSSARAAVSPRVSRGSSLVPSRPSSPPRSPRP